MKASEQPTPTFEEFVAQCRSSFAFIAEFGFEEAPLPQREFINQFQVRFTNGKLIVVTEGINWCLAADTYFEDDAGVRVPLVLFVPQEQRKARAKRLPSEPEQLHEIRSASQWVAEHCVDILRGETARFYDRATEWKRITGRDRSSQKRVLP